MSKWEIQKAFSDEQAELVLEDGWEPFGVEQIMVRGAVKGVHIWFKKAFPLLLTAPKT